MSTTSTLITLNRLAELEQTVGDCERLALHPHDRRRLLATLAVTARRLRSLRRQTLAALLVELLWQYLEHVDGTDAGYVVRQLIADIAATNAER